MNTTAKNTKPRASRKDKAEATANTAALLAADEAAAAKPAANAGNTTTPGATAGAAAAGAAIALLSVVFTNPPAHKLAQPVAEGQPKPYWSVKIADQQGRLYSNVYRFTDRERAVALAKTISAERKIPVDEVTYTAAPAATAQPAAQAPAPSNPVTSDTDDTPLPF